VRSDIKMVELTLIRLRLLTPSKSSLPRMSLTLSGTIGGLSESNWGNATFTALTLVN
jgi:hypothetical protein